MNAVEWAFPIKIGSILFDSKTGQPRQYVDAEQKIRARYKVAYGGRDGAKSWSFARALLLEGAMYPLAIGCFREIQNSIKESVHQLLSNQVEELGLGSFYRVLDHEIRGSNGTYFRFAGLSAQTRDSFKSYEGLDRAWIEEGHSITKRSWNIFEPTIRAPNSEIWVSFNPDLDTDFMYQRFVVNPPPDAIIANVNWDDNPWRSKVLDAARVRMQQEDPQEYAHVYGGLCRPAVDGAIYFQEVAALRQSGRLCNVPYDPMLKVHVFVDLGYNDYMSLIFAQRLASELRVIRYVEDRLRSIPSYHEEMKSFGYNYGKIWLPHDGKAKTAISASNPLGASAEAQFRTLGWDVEMVENIDVEQGIRKARAIFPRVHIDKDLASELLTRLGRYRRRVNKETGQGTTPVHDDESHGSDGFRYFAISADQMSNDNFVIPNLSAFRRAS